MKGIISRSENLSSCRTSINNSCVVMFLSDQGHVELCTVFLFGLPDLVFVVILHAAFHSVDGCFCGHKVGQVVPAAGEW